MTDLLKLSKTNLSKFRVKKGKLYVACHDGHDTAYKN